MSYNSEDGDNKDNKEKDETKLWGILLFGFIGATVTTAAVMQLRNSINFVYSQLHRQASWKGEARGSSRTRYQEETWRRYTRRLQEEYEEEMSRLERIRRMQSAFNRERNKYKSSYERRSEQGSGAYHQDFVRDNWYWHGESSYNDHWTYGWGRNGSGPYGGANYYRETPQATGSYSLSHHYSVLGLDRKRSKPYTDNEIKSAFRSKAMKFHPDQNQDNKVAAEAKFKEVMASYEAIKMERKNK